MSHRAFNNHDMRAILAAKNTAIEALRAEVAELQAENRKLRAEMDRACQVWGPRIRLPPFPAAED